MSTTKQENYPSDKSFWHGFDEFYEKYFENRTFNNIAEIGAAGGASIRWLLERFPNSHIYGADIIGRTNKCPVDDRYKLFQIDQSNVEQLKYFLTQASYDLIIEDGSHHPAHQILSLIEGIKVLVPKGIYILEDIHTSMSAIASGNAGNALSVLLGIQHYRRLNISIDRGIAQKISYNSLMSIDEVLLLEEHIDTIELYKRSRLPDWCAVCKSIDFNFSQFRCGCGTGIFSYDDSMTFVIVKK
jgi:hypothetical protein